MIPMGLVFGTRPWNNELHDAEPKRAKSMQKREECNWCSLSVVATLGGQAKWTGLHDSHGSHDMDNKAVEPKNCTIMHQRLSQRPSLLVSGPNLAKIVGR